MKTPYLLLAAACLGASILHASAQTPVPSAPPISASPSAADSASPAPTPSMPSPLAAAPADVLGTPADVTVMINQFFKTLQKGDVARAYESLSRDSKFASGPNEMETLKKKTSEALRLYGTIRGSETADFQAVGTHLVRVTAISLGSEMPLRWRFYFYQGASGWKLIDLRVDDRLVDLFNEKSASEAAPSPAP